LEITEVLECREGEILLNPLYMFDESGEENGRVKGTLIKKNELQCREKLKRAGIDTITGG
jgi:pilus assembly protein CpaF